MIGAAGIVSKAKRYADLAAGGHGDIDANAHCPILRIGRFREHFEVIVARTRRGRLHHVRHVFDLRAQAVPGNQHQAHHNDGGAAGNDRATEISGGLKH